METTGSQEGQDSLLRKVAAAAKATVRRGIGRVVRLSDMPWITFEMDICGFERAIEEGQMGMFTKNRPGFMASGAPYYVYTREEALAWIASIPVEEITIFGRQFLRLQVLGSGLE